MRLFYITLFLALTGLGASGAEPKRVLFIHSFGRGFEPYHTVAGLFRTELASQMAEPVDFFEASLESARFTGLDQESPLLGYLQAQFAKRPLDLVVPIGGPAAQFVQKHRQQLFPDTPMLIAADQRLFNPNSLTTNDAAALTVNQPGLTLEMLLHVLPEVTNVVVVMGNSAIERFWSTEIRGDFQSYTNRVSFDWLNELPFSEMLKRCAALPPRSAIFFPLLFVDAAGVPHLEEHAMLRLHKTANAPIFGIWINQLGQGILGGRLMDIEEYSRTAATAAARILRGESPGSIKIPPQRPGPPEFDWRELRRCGISEARLPSDSVVRFRQRGVWERYWWLICGGVLFAAAEAALIVGLLVSRRKRRQEEMAATLIAELSSRFVNVPAGTLDREIEEAQRRVCESMGLDLSALWQWTDEPSRYFKMTHLYRPLGGPPIPERFDAQEVFPWCLKQLLAGKAIPVSSMEALPPEAGRDRESWLHFGIKSNLTFPLLMEGGQLIGGLSFNTVRKARTWPEDLVTRLELVAQVSANALARKRADQELRESEARLSLAADAAAVGLWRLDLATKAYWVTKKTRELFAFGTDEVVTFDRVLNLVHPEDRELVRQKVQQVLESKGEVQVEYRILQPDGRVQWMHSRGRVHCDGSGQPDYLMGVTVDATPRKQAEEALRASEQRFRILAESSLVGTYVLQDGRYQYVNPAMAGVFGYSAAEMTGMRPSEIVQPSDQSMVAENIRRRISGEVHSLRYEVRGRHKNGSTRDVEVYGAGLEINGRPALVGTLIDITDRKQAEDALRETQTTLRAIIDSTNDLVWSVDPSSFGLLTFNQRLGDYFLRGRGILIETGMRPEDLFPPGRYVQEWRDFYQRALDEGPFTVEYLTYTQDLLLQLSFNLLKRDGKVFGISVFGKDITELKRTQNALEESVGRFRRVVEHIQDALMVDDVSGRVVFANDRFLELFGVRREELATLTLEDYVAPEFRAELRERHERRVRGEKEPANFEYLGMRRDGRRLWLEVAVVTVADEHGRVTGTQSAIRDIDARKRAEEALRVSQARLASAVEVSGLGFYEMGSDVGQIFVDERLRSLLGLTPQDSHRVQEFWIEHIHLEDRERVRELSRKVLGGELQGVTVEYRYLHPGRGTLWFSHVSRAEEQDATGKTVRRLGVIRDVTEQRQAELESQRLRGNLAHLTRVNTLGALSGSLAHELNQPLGIILSNAQAAQELLTQVPLDTAEVQAILADIVKADRRAGEVIQRLRALFKGGQASVQNLSLNIVIEEVLRLTRAELLGRGVTTICELSPDLPVIAGDRVQLQQLFLNLILNAADAMAANAPGTRRLHLRTMLQPNQVRASVRDEGEGLPADVERLFQPLYTTKPHGLGMGLAICRSIVAAHNGRLWAERHPERGAVFYFELPVAKGEVISNQ